MAMGSRKAFEELPEGEARNRWLSLPFLGCDGLPNSGQVAVRRGLLTATIFIPPNAGKALDMLAHSIQTGTMPPDQTFTTAVSFPAMDVLAQAQDKARAAGKA